MMTRAELKRRIQIYRSHPQDIHVLCDILGELNERTGLTRPLVELDQEKRQPAQEIYGRAEGPARASWRPLDLPSRPKDTIPAQPTESQSSGDQA